MQASDWAQLGLLGNTVAMQWYVLAHPGSQLPQPAAAASISIPGVQASVNTNVVILGAVLIAAFIFLR